MSIRPWKVIRLTPEGRVQPLRVLGHPKPLIQVIHEELGPLTVAPDIERGGAVGVIVGALNHVGDLVAGKLLGEGILLSPRTQTAVTNVSVIVAGIVIVAGVSTAVATHVVDRVYMWVRAERVTIGRLGVMPD